MAFLNLNYGFLIYEDAGNTRNPNIRNPDMTVSIEGCVVDFDKSDRANLYSNEIKDIATTQRSLAWGPSTEIKFYHPTATSSTFRLEHTGTGTAPSFRVDRAIGGSATTEVSITRVTPYVARIQNVAGTAWTLGSVQVNDFIRFEKSTDSFTSPFTANNQDREYLIQNIGADFVDFVDNGAQSDETAILLDTDFAKALKIVSQGPVKRGDLIQVEGSTINPSNKGKFEVMDVSSDYIEFVNPLGVTETLLLGTNTVVVYEYLIGFVHIRASAPIKIRFDAQQEWFQISRLGSQAVFVGSVSAHKIQAFNDRPEPVSISIQHAMVSG